MKIQVEVDISTCKDCVFRRASRGHGECFEFCGHEQSPKGYGSYLYGCNGEFEKVPDWCPIGLEGAK